MASVQGSLPCGNPFPQELTQPCESCINPFPSRGPASLVCQFLKATPPQLYYTGDKVSDVEPLRDKTPSSSSSDVLLACRFSHSGAGVGGQQSTHVFSLGLYVLVWGGKGQVYVCAHLHVYMWTQEVDFKSPPLLTSTVVFN